MTEQDPPPLSTRAKWIVGGALAVVLAAAAASWLIGQALYSMM